MGSSSIWSQLMVTLAFLLLSTLVWEGFLNWKRYEPESGQLGGFRRQGDRILPREPGGSQEGPSLPVAGFRGARYLVLTPRAPLEWVVGRERRCRLVGVYLEGPDGLPRLVPWGGGEDPLAEFLRMTRLLSTHLLPRLEASRHDFVDLDPKALAGPLALRFEGDQLALAPAP